MAIEEDVMLKGGHAPADRVGGRRIPNKKERRSSEGERAPSESSGEEVVRDINERDTGLVAVMEKSYPTSAVREMHDKPIPKHQAQYQSNAPTNVRCHNQVFQPRRVNN